MKNIAKRIGTIAMTLVLVLGMIQLPATTIVGKAADKPTFKVSVDKPDAKAGEVVNVSVALSANSGIYPFHIELGYDSSLMYFDTKAFENPDDAFDESSEMNAGFNSYNWNDPGTIKVVHLSTNALKNGGVLFTFPMTVKENVQGKNSFTFALKEAYTDDRSENELKQSDCIIDTANSSTNVKVDLNGISLDKEAMSLSKGMTGALTVSYNPEVAGNGKTVTWSSDNEAVATVDNGTVTARGVGTTNINANVDGKTAACAVTVTSPLESISLDKTELTLKKGQSDKLTVGYNPTDTTDSKAVTWTSADTSVATVDANGTVTALKDGTSIITAKVGEKTATCTVKVKEVKLTSISLNKASTKLARGDEDTLMVIYNPENTTDDKTITWTSSDESIARVSSTGVVTAVGKGTATITAEVGEKEATCTVEVNVPLKKILLDPISLSMLKGETKPALKVNYIPLDTDDDKTIIWTSSDESVARVSNTGVVTAVSKGTATITAKGVHNIEGTCVVSVEEKPITGITLDVNQKTLEVAESQQLSAAIEPTNTTDDRTVTWTSSNEAIATVDANGLVTAVSGGTATIVATTVNGKTASCTITVPIHMIGIEIPATLELLRGKTSEQPLAVTYAPENTTDDRSITWTSSDETVATVDANGNVTAVNGGVATITATTVMGELTSECIVTVKENHATDAELLEIAATPDTKVNEVLLNSSQKLNVNIIAENPDFATTDILTYAWSSSNANTIEIAQDGTITAKELGNSDITVVVTNEAGNTIATKTMTLSVKSLPLDSIDFKSKIESLEEGSIGQLEIVYTPGNTTDDKTVTWTSSNEKVATINKLGMITAVKAGKTTIKAVVGDKEISYELTVTAKKSNEGGSDSGKKSVDKQNPTNGSVRTGDNYSVTLTVVVMLLAVIMMISTMIIRRKKTK